MTLYWWIRLKQLKAINYALKLQGRWLKFQIKMINQLPAWIVKILWFRSIRLYAAMIRNGSVQDDSN